jgi:hypothetical protein
LLSRATRDLLDERCPLLELGEHRLKDIPDPVAIYQLGSREFPPLLTISNTNLPRPVSSFVGRERELSQLFAAVKEGARLLTLTGHGLSPPLTSRCVWEWSLLRAHERECCS